MCPTWPAQATESTGRRRPILRIGIIGAGKVGATLGSAFAARGHTVRLGSRRPRESGDGPPIVTVADAVAGAEVIVLALPPDAVHEVLTDHAGALDGTLIIDATNRFGAASANAAALVAAAVPTARYARAFNTLGWENFAEPNFDGQQADLFFSCCEADRAVVENLIDAVGLRPAYLGEDRHDVVDGALLLWFALVTAENGNRRIAFRVLRQHTESGSGEPT